MVGSHPGVSYKAPCPGRVPPDRHPRPASRVPARWRPLVSDSCCSTRPVSELVVGGPDTGALVIDRWAPDNLWTSVKAGLLDFADPVTDTAYTTGIEIGPKLPLAQGNRGVGVEGLMLLGFGLRKTQVVVNLGGLIDPAADLSEGPALVSSPPARRRQASARRMLAMSARRSASGSDTRRSSSGRTQIGCCGSGSSAWRGMTCQCTWVRKLPRQA